MTAALLLTAGVLAQLGAPHDVDGGAPPASIEALTDAGAADGGVADGGVTAPATGAESVPATSEPDGGTEPGADEHAATPVETEGGHSTFRGALEAAITSFPSGPPGGDQDVFANVTPLISIDAGDDFGFELGATLRLRLFDDPPLQRDNDIKGLLRREDWDEPSDFGQILRLLRIGTSGSAFHLRGGAFQQETLGLGHLISRYSNQTNADYHPAGARLESFIGPVHTELFASDVLGARLFAAELALDLGRILSGGKAEPDRFHVAFSAAYDAGRAGGTSPPITLMDLDADYGLVRRETVRASLFAGIGSRVFLDDVPAVGFVAGAAVDGEPSSAVQLGGKLEIRKEAGGFRFGLFGPFYELARFSGIGLANAPLADEQLPDSFSGYGEVQLVTGAQDGEGGRFSFSAAGELFAWGRADVDAILTLRTPNGRGALVGRFGATGLGQAPRYFGQAEVRYRLLPSLYALANGGTVFFPQPDGSLSRGFFAGVGIGADFER